MTTRQRILSLLILTALQAGRIYACTVEFHYRGGGTHDVVSLPARGGLDDTGSTYVFVDNYSGGPCVVTATSSGFARLVVGSSTVSTVTIDYTNQPGGPTPGFRVAADRNFSRSSRQTTVSINECVLTVIQSGDPSAPANRRLPPLPIPSVPDNAPCSLPSSVPALKQSDPRWSNPETPYGFTDRNGAAKTLGAKGCALTSLSMAFSYLSTSDAFQMNDATPGRLNAFMRDANTFTPSSDVKFGETVSAATMGGSPFRIPFAPGPSAIKWNTMGGRKDSLSEPIAARTQLDAALCGSTGTKTSTSIRHPIIVAVRGRCGSGSYPGHFVLVTGKTVNANGTISYAINDPANCGFSTLDDYGNQFETRGTVQDPPADRSAIELSATPGAVLLLTSPSNQRLGIDSATFAHFDEIDNSAEWRDSIEDDETSEAPGVATHFLHVFNPEAGEYVLETRGVDAMTPVVVTLQAWSSDGSPQDSRKLTTADGARTTLSVRLAFTAPEGLTATATSRSSVLVTWNGVAGAEAYEVYRGSNSTTFVHVGIAAGVNSYVDSGLAADTSYLYKVRANTGGGGLPFSAIDVATTTIFTTEARGGSLVWAEQFIETLTAVNAMRMVAGLPAVAFRRALTRGAFIEGTDLSILRSGLDAARTELGLPPVSFTDPVIQPHVTPVRAIHLQEVQAGVK